MQEKIQFIGPKALKAQLHDGQEIALLDAREEVPFDKRHLFKASCVPLSRLEMRVHDLVPRRNTRVVWCDDGDGLAARAAVRMAALGYTQVSVLDGGMAAWSQAGYRTYNGVHVPSKAFAEVVEHETGTPWITAEQLQAMIDHGEDMIILDSRSYEEYHSDSIPGAVSVPGAELVYRFTDLVPSSNTTVVVNCGGRTRSIIGAQSLINAGFPNKIVSLKNGTQGWRLAGYHVVEGATRRPPDVSAAGLAAAREAAARVRARCAVEVIDKAKLNAWRAEAAQRTLYLLDVRTPEEYEAGHVPGTLPAPGGQLIQETDHYLATWGSRVVLFDDNGVRATMTASWLIQMGWKEVAIMTMGAAGDDRIQGPHIPHTLGLENLAVAVMEAAELHQALTAATGQVIDLNWSRQYDLGHIPGAWFAIRSRLPDAVRVLPPTGTLVLTSPDGVLARLAAADLQGVTSVPVKVLAGGTQAWIQAGFPLEQGSTRMASPAEDIRLRGREQKKNREEAMRNYLAWEIELINQMSTEDDQHFRVLT